MFSSLVERHAYLLDVEDAIDLFDNLARIYHGIKGASARCGIARSTRYIWEEAEYIKLETKKKVLDASLNERPAETLDFLMKKSKENTADLLLMYLSIIYQRALDESIDSEAFENLLNTFLTARRNHFGLISDEIEDDVNEMLMVLEGEAKKRDITPSPDTLNMIKPRYLLEIMPNVVSDIVQKKDLLAVSRKYDVPMEVPQALSKALEGMTVRRTILSFYQEKITVEGVKSEETSLTDLLNGIESEITAESYAR